MNTVKSSPHSNVIQDFKLDLQCYLLETVKKYFICLKRCIIGKPDFITQEQDGFFLVASPTRLELRFVGG